MNDSGKNAGHPPKEGGRRSFQRQGPGRHAPGQKGQTGQVPRGQRENTQAQSRKEEPKRLPAVDCAICNKPIYDLAGALADMDTGLPVHFDCALERVAAAESVAGKEKIVYLGAGCFGVVEYKNGTEGAFTVKRRIRWEKEGEKQGWRKDISSYITKL